MVLHTLSSVSAIVECSGAVGFVPIVGCGLCVGLLALEHGDCVRRRLGDGDSDSDPEAAVAVGGDEHTNGAEEATLGGEGLCSKKKRPCNSFDIVLRLEWKSSIAAVQTPKIYHLHTELGMPLSPVHKSQELG